MHFFRFVVLFLSCLLSAFSLFSNDNAQRGYLFAKVKAQGSLLGKDRFLLYYRIAPGEPFSIEKHAHSLTKIRAALKDEGYLNAKITDKIHYHDKSKTVSVSLTLLAGNRFIIDHVSIQLVGDGAQEVELAAELEKLTQGSLLKAYFAKELVDKQASLIKSLLRQRGYGQPKISLSSSHDGAEKATLVFQVILGKKKLLIFEGNTFFSRDELCNELSALDGDGVPLPPPLLAEEIEILYKRKGFFDVRVTVLEKPQALRYYIAEGIRTHPWMSAVKLSFDGGKPEDKEVSAVLAKTVALISSYATYDADEINRRVEKLPKNYALLAIGIPR